MAYSDADRLLTVRGTLTYPDTGTQALTSAHISSFLVNEDAGRDVPVGAAPAASFELKLDNSSGQWEPGGSILGAHVLDGAKVEIEIGLWNGAAYDYSDIGTYYVDDVQGQEHETLIRLKGSDAMVSLMSEYYADGAGDYPQTLSSLLTDIAAAAGVTLESSTFTNSTVSIPAQPAWKNNLTCREAVGYIAACAGGIARFNRAGKLEIAPLEKVSSRAVSTSVYKTIQKGDTFFGGLNAINVYAYGAPDGTSPSRYATTPATPDTSLNSINIRDNPILAYGSTALATLGAGMLSALTGLAFRGATFEWHGDPAVELGELCTVTDLSSTAIPILITKQTLRFASGFSMNSGCTVTTSTKADASGKLQKIFTPTGNLNAEALAGNIYVKAGEKMTLESGGIMNVLSGGDINVASGGDINVASGGKINLTTANDLVLGAQNITTFTDGRIDAKASTIDLSANNSIKLTVKDAASGGTNLLLNSDWSKGLQSGWTTTGPGYLDTNASYLYNGKIPLRLVTEAGTTNRYSTQTVGVNTMDTNKFTLSFRYRVNSGILALAGNNRVATVNCKDSSDTTIDTLYITYPELTGGVSWARKELSFTAPAGTEKINVVMYARSDGVSSNMIWLSDVKLEKGTQATDWSPAPSDPASTLENSGISIGADHLDLFSSGVLSATGSTIALKTNDFTINADNADETEIMSVTPTGINIGAEYLHGNRIRGDVVNTHSGTTVYADAGIQTAIDGLGKYLSAPTTVYVNSGTYNEHIVISGFFGDTLTLNFQDNVKINGSISIVGNGYVYLNGGSSVKTIVVHTGADYTDAIYAKNNTRFQAINMRVIGKARTSLTNGTRSGFNVESGAGYITACIVQKVRYGLLFQYGATGHVYNCTGGIAGSSSTDYSTLCILTSAVASFSGSHVGVQGTLPTAPTVLQTSYGTIVGTAPAGTQETVSAPATETSAVFTSTGTRRLKATQTRTGFKATGASSISWNEWGGAVNGNWGSGLPRQGTLTRAYTVSSTVGTYYTYYSQVRELYYSAWLFGALTNIANATQVKMTITRSSDHGATGAETFTLYRHDYTSAPTGSDYSALSTTGITVTLARGETKTIAITGSTLTNLKNGAIKGFGLHGSGGNHAQCTGTMKLEVYY